MKKFLITFFCFLIIMPAFAGMRTVMTRCMDSWKGYEFDELLNVWGRPTKQEKIDGKYYYYWEESVSQNIGKPYLVSGGTSTCTRIVMIEAGDEITECTWSGAACPASYLTVKKWVNPQNDPWEHDAEIREQNRMKHPVLQIFYDIKLKSKDWFSP